LESLADHGAIAGAPALQAFILTIGLINSGASTLHSSGVAQKIDHFG
jgi:hypothetical protein